MIVGPCRDLQSVGLLPSVRPDILLPRAFPDCYTLGSFHTMVDSASPEVCLHNQRVFIDDCGAGMEATRSTMFHSSQSRKNLGSMYYLLWRRFPFLGCENEREGYN